uniref:Bm10981 n=1 Tax=Brugia malayi TaxID=6279 RepID=A0A0H5SBF0_BRUMA|nr:Bm10981 [Brugia malayi]
MTRICSHYDLWIFSAHKDTQYHHYLSNEKNCPPIRIIEILLNWKEGAIIADKFGEKWQTQYLQTLRDRKQRENKGHAQTKRIPQVGEIVLRTGAVPRGCWPLARITKLVVQAGNIRAAQLKMSNGHIWERSLNHLYPLELSISQNKQYQVVDPNIELEDNEDEKKLSIRPRFGGRKTMPKS